MVNIKSKSWIVALVLTLGVLAMFVLQQPHSPCVNQVELFKSSLEGVLYPKKVKNATRPAVFNESINACKIGNSAGACGPFFESLRKIQVEFSLVASRCSGEMGDHPDIVRFIQRSLEVIVQLAWVTSQSSPDTHLLGWLGPAEMSIFCRLKNSYVEGFGSEDFESLQRQIVQRLKVPDCINCETRSNSGNDNFENRWKKTIFAISCGQYL
jgi:hypothetical protein